MEYCIEYEDSVHHRLKEWRFRNLVSLARGSSSSPRVLAKAEQDRLP